MKKTIKLGFFTAILVLLWGMVLGQAVLAEPQEALTGEIILPVTIRAEGTLPDTPDVYTLVLEGEEGVPMPEGSEGQRYQLQVTGAQTTAFPTIVCNTVGIYRYTISQEPGENAYCTYDRVKYEVVVTVTYPAQGDALDVAVAITPGSATLKSEAALFVNSYERPPVEIPQTGESGNLPLMLGLWVCSLLALALVWKQRKTV